MAIAIVNKKQTAAASAATLAITSATAGNRLVAFIAKSGSTVAPKAKDNISGETGWTVNTTKAIYTTSGDSLWFAEKVAVGGETELNPAVNGGTMQGIAYLELSGASSTVDAITHKDNVASAATATSEAITTTDAGDILLAAVGLPNAGASGTITAWTGTGPMTNVETVSTRCIGGSYLPGTTLSAVTFTANWTSARTNGLLVIALKPSGAETKTVTALVHGAGAATASASKVATPSILIRGAGLPVASSIKVALATGAVTGAGLAKASPTKIATPTALVHGAGNATVTLTAAGEVKTVTALIHGAGRATALTIRIGLATAKASGAGNATATTRKVAVTTAVITGAGAASTRASKVATVTGNVTGAGRATAVLVSGAIAKPCLMHLSAQPKITMTLSARPTVSMTLTARPAVRMSLEAR